MLSSPPYDLTLTEWTAAQMELIVEAYLPEDRQWPRHLRIAHAHYQLQQHAKGTLGAAFWRNVIKANEL